MKIDLHTHGKSTSSKPFLTSDFDKKVAVAIEKGLDAFVQLEHLHASNFFEFLGHLRVNYTQQHDYYAVDGIKVFVGVEVTVKEKHDIVLVGSVSDIELLTGHLICGKGYSKTEKTIKRGEINAEELLSICRGYNLIKILAHPFRHSDTINLKGATIKRLDALEINANEVSNKGEYKERERIERFAAKYGVAVSGGSDAHTPVRVGCVYSVLENDCSTIEELRLALQNNKVEINNKK